MNWNEYLLAKEALKIDDDNPPSLFQSGVAGDNATRYLLNQKGTEFPNDELLFQSNLEDRDFVWNGRRVRAHTGFSSGGHPALAGTDTIYCAGRIKSGYFYFHSGHYHPKLPHALHFFSDFVKNTCDGLAGDLRDQKVGELCGIRLKLYRDKSETETYSVTFAQLAAPNAAIGNPGTGIGIPIGKGIPRSQPMSMPGRPVSPERGPSKPVTIREEIQDSPATLLEETGISPYGSHQLKVRVLGAPPWIEDNARIKCALCAKTFGVMTRRHHCRRCGEIVCAGCSGHTKMVKHPAVNPKSTTAEKQPVRVCDLCVNRADLL